MCVYFNEIIRQFSSYANFQVIIGQMTVSSMQRMGEYEVEMLYLVFFFFCFVLIVFGALLEHCFAIVSFSSSV